MMQPRGQPERPGMRQAGVVREAALEKSCLLSTSLSGFADSLQHFESAKEKHAIFKWLTNVRTLQLGKIIKSPDY